MNKEQCCNFCVQLKGGCGNPDCNCHPDSPKVTAYTIGETLEAEKADSPKAEWGWENDFDNLHFMLQGKTHTNDSYKDFIRQTILKYIDMVELKPREQTRFEFMSDEAACSDCGAREANYHKWPCSKAEAIIFNQAVDELNSKKEKIKESLTL